MPEWRRALLVADCEAQPCPTQTLGLDRSMHHWSEFSLEKSSEVRELVAANEDPHVTERTIIKEEFRFSRSAKEQETRAVDLQLAGEWRSLCSLVVALRDASAVLRKQRPEGIREGAELDHSG